MLGAANLAQIDFRLLFETMSEGVVLCEPICETDGRLVDYRFLQANPAFLRGFRVGRDIVGRRFKELRPDATPAWFANFQETIDSGKPRRFQYHDASRHRWYEVHCTLISADRFAHFYIDITSLKRAEAHQAALLDELNHRVKNNLAIVAGLLSLQARNAPPEVTDHLRAAVSRVHAVADLHAELYRQHDQKYVAMDQYLQDLAVRLSQSIVGDRIRLVVDAEDLPVNLEQAVQLGLVVNELVTNAIKHAFPEREQGVVSVRLAAGAETLLLTVSDDGRGLPPESETHRGLGGRIVDSFVRQCGGTLTVTSDQRGAAFAIQVPWRRPQTSPAQNQTLL